MTLAMFMSRLRLRRTQREHEEDGTNQEQLRLRPRRMRLRPRPELWDTATSHDAIGPGASLIAPCVMRFEGTRERSVVTQVRRALGRRLGRGTADGAWAF